MPTTSAIAEERFLSEVSSKLDEITYVFAPKLPGSLKDFMRFARITNPEVFRVVTRAHLIAWRKDLEGRGCEGPTIRRKLSAVSSLFEYLCERNAVVHNPVTLLLDSGVL